MINQFTPLQTRVSEIFSFLISALGFPSIVSAPDGCIVIVLLVLSIFLTTNLKLLLADANGKFITLFPKLASHIITSPLAAVYGVVGSFTVWICNSATSIWS